MPKVALNAAPRPARTAHMMKAGESLASVALKTYGDARFARLIFTINRGDVQTCSDGYSSFAFVAPGQTLVLPTYEEARIFAGHFFTAQSQSKFDLAYFARPAMPSDSISGKILPLQGSRAPGQDRSASDSSFKKLLPPLPYLEVGNQQAGNRQMESPKVPDQAQVSHQAAFATATNTGANQFECQYIVKQPAQQSLEVFDMSPPTVNVPRLQDGHSPVEGPEVVSFSHYCRMIRFDAEGGQSDTIIKLQVLEETRWQTITAYVITEQTSRRVAHYAQGNEQAVNIELPSAVARELSISDLKRNWKEYVRCYLNSQEKLASFVPENGSLLQAC